MPVELRGRAGTLTKIVELLRFRWIEESGRGESIDEEIVANAPVLAAVISVEIVIFERGAAKVNPWPPRSAPERVVMSSTPPKRLPYSGVNPPVIRSTVSKI